MNQRQLTASLSLSLAPVALFQAVRLKRRAMRLPEAAGQRHGQTSGSGHPLRMLAVGESPLAAVGLANPQDTVARHLAENIAKASSRPVSWRILARGGFTAAAVRKRLVSKLELWPADLILIGLGVNDSIRLRSARRWRADLHALIDDLHRRTGPAPILLAGVPDMYHFPLLPPTLRLVLGSRSRLLDSATDQLAAQLPRARYVSMQLDARSQELFCEDGFHPNAEGHVLWAEQLTPAALALLEPPNEAQASVAA